MKHIYRITGMSCEGCKTSVEQSLNSLHEIEEKLGPGLLEEFREKFVLIYKELEEIKADFSNT